jgi:hypothetical protein
MPTAEMFATAVSAASMSTSTMAAASASTAAGVRL